MAEQLLEDYPRAGTTRKKQIESMYAEIRPRFPAPSRPTASLSPYVVDLTPNKKKRKSWGLTKLGHDVDLSVYQQSLPLLQKKPDNPPAHVVMEKVYWVQHIVFNDGGKQISKRLTPEEALDILTGEQL